MTQPENKTNTHHHSMSDLLRKTVDKIDVLYQKGGNYTAINTGFSDFDNLTTGLQPSELIVIAGRPSMGTSTFATNIVEHVAIDSGIGVAVFSMEMSAEALLLRMLSSRGKINQMRVRSGQLEEDDWPRLTDAVSSLNEANIFIDDSPVLSPTEIQDRVQQLNIEHKIGLIVIDNLQLMKLQKETENREAEVSEISRELKLLATEFNIPVIVLSAINSEIEERPNKRPVLSDLYQTESLEKDADLIVFIYRDELYCESTADKGVADIIIGKHRYGPQGVVKLKFMGQYSKFEDNLYSFNDD